MIDFAFTQKLQWEKIVGLLSLNDRKGLFNYFEGYRGNTPFVGEIETTNACVYQCIMCPRGRGHMVRKIGHMSQHLFENIIDSVVRYSAAYKKQVKIFNSIEQFHEVCGLRLHHFGDPLLDPFLLDRIKYIKSQCDLPIHFSANPQFLNRSLAQGLLMAGLDRIVIALDAVDEKTLRAVRGPMAMYNVSLSNTETMLSLKKQLSADTLIDLQIVVLKANRAQVDQFQRVWYGRADRVLVKDFVPYPDVPTEIAPIQPRVVLSNPVIRRLCKRPFYAMSVLQDGRVVPCSFDYNGEITVGDLNNQTLEDVWNSWKFKSFRKAFILGDLDQKDLCYRCGQYLWANNAIRKEILLTV